MQATSMESSWHGGPPSPTFIPRLALLEIFLDEAKLASQLRHSQMLRSSFASSVGGVTHGEVDPSDSALAAMLLLHKSSIKDNNYLDRTIDSFTLTEREQNVDGNSCKETLLHVLGILRRVPLKTLHSATGWRADVDQIRRARAKICDFFQDQPREARRCLWHATCIFRSTRNTRLLACYDTFSVMVSTCYLYCYCELNHTSYAQSNTLSRSGHVSQQEPAVRLDRLRDRSSIENWIQDSSCQRPIHLTGIGLLKGPDQSARLLNDVGKTLSSQIAWRGFACAFATCFKRLGQGGNPSLLEEVR